jgi:CheY-like chemotaxis protein
VVQEAPPPERVRDYSGPRLSILLVDDDPAHLDIVQNLLRPLNFNLLTAADGRTGLAMASEHKPELAMIDISLPDMTGWQVSERLRALAEPRSMKIVMVSANAHEYSSGGGDDSLHDAFIMKPINLQLMLECVGRLLGVKWIYENPQRMVAGTADAADSLPAHSRHHLDDLYQLGRIGHVRGIQAKLREMETENAANQPFAAHLRVLVANFDLKRYMNVLEELRKHGQKYG